MTCHGHKKNVKGFAVFLCVLITFAFVNYIKFITAGHFFTVNILPLKYGVITDVPLPCLYITISKSF